jgi:hypothetical protein
MASMKASKKERKKESGYEKARAIYSPTFNYFVGIIWKGRILLREVFDTEDEDLFYRRKHSRDATKRVEIEFSPEDIEFISKFLLFRTKAIPMGPFAINYSPIRICEVIRPGLVEMRRFEVVDVLVKIDSALGRLKRNEVKLRYRDDTYGLEFCWKKPDDLSIFDRKERFVRRLMMEEVSGLGVIPRPIPSDEVTAVFVGDEFLAVVRGSKLLSRKVTCNPLLCYYHGVSDGYVGEDLAVDIGYERMLFPREQAHSVNGVIYKRSPRANVLAWILSKEKEAILFPKMHKKRARLLDYPAEGEVCVQLLDGGEKIYFSGDYRYHFDVRCLLFEVEELPEIPFGVDPFDYFGWNPSPYEGVGCFGYDLEFYFFSRRSGEDKRWLVCNAVTKIDDELFFGFGRDSIKSVEKVVSFCSLRRRDFYELFGELMCEDLMGLLFEFVADGFFEELEVDHEKNEEIRFVHEIWEQNHRTKYMDVILEAYKRRGKWIG